MAEPFKRDGVWLVPWKNHKGRWKQERTKAKTKAEARRIRNDLERHAERQRLGLEPLPTATPQVTFGALMDLWWEKYGRKLHSHKAKGFIDKHLRPALGELLLDEVADNVEALFNDLDSKLSKKNDAYSRN